MPLLDDDLGGPLPQPEDTLALVERLTKLASRAAKGKVRPTCGTHWHTLWDKWWRRYRGHHYDEGEEPGNQITINKLRPAVQRSAATLAASPPRFTVEPVEPGDIVSARLFQLLFDVSMNTPELIAQYNEVCKWQRLCGAGVGIVEWDPDLARGRGDVAFRFLDPRFCYPDPLARNRSEMMYWIRAYPMALTKARAWWPELADELTDHPNWGVGLGSSSGPGVDIFGAAGNFFAEWSSRPAGRSGGGMGLKSGQCLVMECITRPELSGGDWRRTIVLNGRHVAEDGAWPLQDWPVVFFTNDEEPDTIFGDGIAVDGEPIETLIENRHNQIADHQQAQMLGIIFVPVGSVDRATMERLANLPFEIVPYDPIVQDVPKAAQPVPISGDFFRILDVADGIWEEVTGNNKALQGLVPEGASSGLEQAYRQEAATIPLTPIRRNNEAQLHHIGMMAARLMQQRYNASRFVRIVGNSEVVRPEFWRSLGLPPEGMAEKGPLWAYLYMGGAEAPPPLDAEGRIIPFTREQFLIELDCKVSAGSTMPTSKTAEYERARDLYELNPSPVMYRALLEYSGLPEWERYWAMIQEAMTAAQPPAGPQGLTQPPAGPQGLIGPPAEGPIGPAPPPVGIGTL